jgi:MYXO-CTERM domain-containing protein
MSLWRLQLFAAVALVGTAAADPPPRTGYFINGQLAGSQSGQTQPLPGPPAGAQISPYIYFTRCMGGCTITAGSGDDARSNKSSIPAAGSYTVAEFENSFGQNSTANPKGTCLHADWSVGSPTTTCAADADCTGAFGAGAICDTADWEWNQVIQCVKEVYSPFALNFVADTTVAMRPTTGVSYTMGVVGGMPTDVGLPLGFCGVASGRLAGDCSPHDNVLSFTFSNFNCGTSNVRARVYDVCATASQETAHSFGLDHEFSFLDGTSACSDPMSYDHCGQQFFRNKEAMCGAFGDGNAMPPRQCLCGGTQNSHASILAVFGPGTSLIPAPTSSITFPADGATVTNNWNTVVSSGSQRGVAAVELWLNGYKWASKPGADFGTSGQPNPSTYSLVAPNGIPDGGIKVVAKAFDDLGAEGDATITLTKGALCTSDDSCNAAQPGMKCNTGAANATVAAGGCYWDPPAGNVGDKCTYNEFCLSGICQGPADGLICTQHCIMGVQDSCPANFECDQASDGQSYCFTAAPAGTGCCSTDRRGPAWPHVMFAMLVMGIILRRRRQRCAV